MRKISIFLVSVLVILGLSLGGARYYVGQQFKANLAALEQQMTASSLQFKLVSLEQGLFKNNLKYVIKPENIPMGSLEFIVQDTVYFLPMLIWRSQFPQATVDQMVATSGQITSSLDVTGTISTSLSWQGHKQSHLHLLLPKPSPYATVDVEWNQGLDPQWKGSLNFNPAPEALAVETGLKIRPSTLKVQALQQGLNAAFPNYEIQMALDKLSLEKPQKNLSFESTKFQIKSLANPLNHRHQLNMQFDMAKMMVNTVQLGPISNQFSMEQAANDLSKLLPARPIMNQDKAPRITYDIDPYMINFDNLDFGFVMHNQLKVTLLDKMLEINANLEIPFGTKFQDTSDKVALGMNLLSKLEGEVTGLIPKALLIESLSHYPQAKIMLPKEAPPGMTLAPLAPAPAVPLVTAHADTVPAPTTTSIPMMSQAPMVIPSLPQKPLLSETPKAAPLPASPIDNPKPATLAQAGNLVTNEVIVTPQMTPNPVVEPPKPMTALPNTPQNTPQSSPVTPIALPAPILATQDDKFQQTADLIQSWVDKKWLIDAPEGYRFKFTYSKEIMKLNDEVFQPG